MTTDIVNDSTARCLWCSISNATGGTGFLPCRARAVRASVKLVRAMCGSCVHNVPASEELCESWCMRNTKAVNHLPKDCWNANSHKVVTFSDCQGVLFDHCANCLVLSSSTIVN